MFSGENTASRSWGHLTIPSLMDSPCEPETMCWIWITKWNVFFLIEIQVFQSCAHEHHPIVYHPAFCFRKHFYMVEGERPSLEYNSQSPGLGTDLGKPMELAALWSSTHCSGRALALLLTRNVTSGRILT